MQTEIWKQSIDDIEVSSLGRVRKDSNIIKQYITGRGYRMADVGKKKHLVHRLVAVAFHGVPQAGYYVKQKNGNTLDVFPGNLEWATMSECICSARKGGRKMNSALTPEEVLYIASAPKKERKALAARHGVDVRTIWAIQTGVNWAWLTKPYAAQGEKFHSAIPDYR